MGTFTNINNSKISRRRLLTEKNCNNIICRTYEVGEITYKLGIDSDLIQDHIMFNNKSLMVFFDTKENISAWLDECFFYGLPSSSDYLVIYAVPYISMCWIANYDKALREKLAPPEYF